MRIIRPNVLFLRVKNKGLGGLGFVQAYVGLIFQEKLGQKI